MKNLAVTIRTHTHTHTHTQKQTHMLNIVPQTLVGHLSFDQH